MSAIESPAEKIRFDVFEVDLRAGELLKEAAKSNYKNNHSVFCFSCCSGGER